MAGTANITGSFTNGGYLEVDNVGSGGGSSLTVGGVLANTGSVQFGPTNASLSAAMTVTLGGLTNAGGASFAIQGSAKEQATLIFSAGGNGFTVNGGTFVMTDAAPLTLDSSFTNSAGATFNLQGSTLAFGGSFTNGGYLEVDNVGSGGGSSLTVGGVLANTGSVQFGPTNASLSAAMTVTLGGLTNARGASFAIQGSAKEQATLIFSAGGNGFTVNGGTFLMTDAAPLTLDSSFTNSAGATFNLQGSTLAFGGSFTNGGYLEVDNVGSGGGSSLTVGGVLANTGSVQFGPTNASLSAAMTVTLGGLTNAGGASFAIQGSAKEQATLIFSAGGNGFTVNGGTFVMTDAAPLTLDSGFTNSRALRSTCKARRWHSAAASPTAGICRSTTSAAGVAAA